MDPQVCFAQVEAQFATKEITEIRLRGSSLALKFAIEICNFVLHPPETDPYDTLKEQLITRTAAETPTFVQCRGVRGQEAIPTVMSDAATFQ